MMTRFPLPRFSQIWQVANIFDCALAMPHIWRACLTPMQTNLASEPIYRF